MILIFVSSLNENMKLAENLKTELSQMKIDSEIINLVDLNLPMYDTRKEQNDGVPSIALDLANKMKNSSGYIFVTTEYNYSVPPVFANMIAWVSRIGDDFRALFTLKTIQLATHSGSNGIDVLNAMRIQFTRLGAIVMPREILTTYTKPLDIESSQKILKQFIENIKR